MNGAVHATLAGVRVLRSVGPGARCALQLGHIPSDEGPGSAVVLKVVSGEDATVRAGREIAALERGAGDQVVRLLDVSDDGQNAVLFLEWHAGPSLEELLTRRTHWEAGEVVTIIAPLASALLRMHASGVAHGAVSAAHIVFSASGAPTLVGFGTATFLPAAAPELVLAAHPAVRSDRDAVRTLALDLLARVAGDRREAAQRFAQQLRSAEVDAVLPLCAESLFSVAAARPVAVERMSGAEAELSARKAGYTERAFDAGSAAWETAPPGTWSVLAGLVPDAWLSELESRYAAMRRTIDAVREALPQKRATPRTPADSSATQPAAIEREIPGERRTSRSRLILVGVAVAAVLSVGALVALPPQTSTAARSQEADGRGGIVEGATPAASSGPSASAAGASPDPTGGGRDHNDPDTRPTAKADSDPVAAAATLLARRAECYRSLSTDCVAGIAQPGSPADAADRREIAAARERGMTSADAPILAADADIDLVEHLGGFALLRGWDGAESATILLVVTEDGWKMRELIPAVPE